MQFTYFQIDNFILHLWQHTQLQMGMPFAKDVQQMLIFQLPRSELYILLQLCDVTLMHEIYDYAD